MLWGIQTVSLTCPRAYLACLMTYTGGTLLANRRELAGALVQRVLRKSTVIELAVPTYQDRA
jgi:CobQ-like glutamine amidotransferase family enzyme